MAGSGRLRVAPQTITPLKLGDPRAAGPEETVPASTIAQTTTRPQPDKASANVPGTVAGRMSREASLPTSRLERLGAPLRARPLSGVLFRCGRRTVADDPNRVSAERSRASRKPLPRRPLPHIQNRP